MRHVHLELRDEGFRVEEAVRMLRTNIQFSGNLTRVILMTSCGPEEGKSTVALMLSRALAESGRNVVYLDADMRGSVTAERVTGDASGKSSLSWYLTGQCGIEDMLLETDIPGLYMVLAGKSSAGSAELLDGRRFVSLIHVLREAFDYVIVDTPPLIGVADSAIAAKECDGAVLVVESGAVGPNLAREAEDLLERAGCPLLGVALNRVRRTNRTYGRRKAETEGRGLFRKSHSESRTAVSHASGSGDSPVTEPRRRSLSSVNLKISLPARKKKAEADLSLELPKRKEKAEKNIGFQVDLPPAEKEAEEDAKLTLDLPERKKEEEAPDLRIAIPESQSGAKPKSSVDLWIRSREKRRGQ
ncbi:MAG: CpsD/CapB family tyrosine-protein kinase [Eubacteriales bacterium]|nr:CpsD/CapB family tyrosine-protein kinase [Eubacteriales bacterium]